MSSPLTTKLGTIDGGEPCAPRPWDARLARALVCPLKDSRVTPNDLTTVRLLVGLLGAAAFVPGTYGWSNVAALLVIVSNFLDHTDGELARLSGKTSRFGHLYDLASDALITTLLFVSIGIGVGAAATEKPLPLFLPPSALGALAGVSVATIFLLRMRIEDMIGKAGTRQASIAGFETEDILYLLPLVTLCNATRGFLLAAAIGAPVFAIWVVIDYCRVRRRSQVTASADGARSIHSTQAMPASALPAATMSARLQAFDVGRLAREFSEQGAFLYLPDFLPPEFTTQLIAAVDAVKASVHRNYLPGHKQGGSVSHHAIDELAPFIGALYRAPALIDWLQRIAGERLQPCPEDDPHAYAFYFYTRPGDHIGWHYDNSYYAGRRYTLLLGAVDESSSRLEYELHTRDADAATVAGSVQIPPGGLVFFDGDRLRHRITPLGSGELRVSLTFEYVTDPYMRPWWRFVSNMKDSLAYFGFRQVFRGAKTGRNEPG